jgi:SAM-dependent methyltransferase
MARTGAIPEGLTERLLLRLGLLPTPLLDTFPAVIQARAIFVATRLGIFESLASQARTAADVARECGTDPRATAKLLNALVGASYLRYKGELYSLRHVARRWLLESSEKSLRDNMLYRALEWQAIEHTEDFVRTGRPLNVHDELTPQMWRVYQYGMRSLAGLSSREVALRTPVPRGARELIDIGGSHGYYSVALCRRHHALKATILDLPDAVRHAAPILAKEQMGHRVVHRSGSAITEELGEGRWDLALVSQLLHHFDDETNRGLVRRVAKALRPGGVLAILEPLRPASPGHVGQLGALLDLFFAVTSQSGTWSWQEISEWQRAAGLVPRKLIRLLTIPGAGIQAATKPPLP